MSCARRTTEIAELPKFGFVIEPGDTDPGLADCQSPSMGVSAPSNRDLSGSPNRSPSSRTNPDLLSRVVANDKSVEVCSGCVERSEVGRVARSCGLERGADRVVGHQ